MKKVDFKNSAELFLYKAKVDLNSSKCLYHAFQKNDTELDLEKIYFDLQQCAEKLLKSILSHHGISFPKTHDIEHLLNYCQDHLIALPPHSDALIDLTDYATEGRYSIIHEDVDEVDRYTALLENLLVFTENLVKQTKASF